MCLNTDRQATGREGGFIYMWVEDWTKLMRFGGSRVSFAPFNLHFASCYLWALLTVWVNIAKTRKAKMIEQSISSLSIFVYGWEGKQVKGSGDVLDWSSKSISSPFDWGPQEKIFLWLVVDKSELGFPPLLDIEQTSFSTHQFLWFLSADVSQDYQSFISSINKSRQWQLPI